MEKLLKHGGANKYVIQVMQTNRTENYGHSGKSKKTYITFFQATSFGVKCSICFATGTTSFSIQMVYYLLLQQPESRVFIRHRR